MSANGAEKHPGNVFLRDSPRALSFPSPSLPPSLIAFRGRTRAAELGEEESILMVSGSLATAIQFERSFVRPTSRRASEPPSDIAKTTVHPSFPQSPQFVQQTEHTDKLRGHANELGFFTFPESDRKQHLSAFCIFVHSPKSISRVATVSVWGVEKGGTDCGRACF